MALQNDIAIEKEASEKEAKPGYKKTKLGWIPEDWITPTIGETFKFLKTYSFSRENLNYDDVSKVFYIHYGDIHTTYKSALLDFEDSIRIPRVNMDIALPSSDDYLRNGDVIVADASEDYDGIGKAIEISNIGNIKAISGLHTFALREMENKTIEGFRAYIFKNPKVEIALKIIATGSKVYGISKANIKKFTIVIPGIEEQIKMANCLYTWDNAIQALSKLIDQKNLQKKALMQHLLTGKKRLKGFSGDWEKLIFSNIAKRVNRKNTELNDTVVTISAQRGFVLQEDFFNKRVASDTLLNYTLVHKGEYCYNKSYSNGYPMGAFKRLDAFEKAVVTTLYICFSLKNNVDSEFMNQYFNAGRMIPGLMKIAQEGGRAHGLLNISLPDFFNLPVTIPTKEEQIAIANVLQQSDEEIALLNKKLHQLKQQKKGLMQQLLTGKKRLKF